VIIIADMSLSEIAFVKSGYISRGRIEPDNNGSHLLLQASDVDSERLTYGVNDLVRFNPHMSPSDSALMVGDILFMARGFKNFSILIDAIQENVLAAACFFVIRTRIKDILPEYLCWYLNQPPVEEYLRRNIGRGVNMPIVRRAVLERINVPIPPTETQRRVAELTKLLAHEHDLLTKLSQKRKKLIAGACLKAVRNHAD
jgi:hypothetical protein